MARRRVLLPCSCGKVHQIADPGGNRRLRCKATGAALLYECHTTGQYRLRGRRRDLILGERRVTLGRDPGNTFVMEHPGISRQHCVFHLTRDGYLLEDLGSANGTFVNRRRLEPGKRYRLHPGMLLRFGREVFRYLVPHEDEGRDPAAAAAEDSAAVAVDSAPAARPAWADDELLGTALGEYTLESVLAQGGMGRIYRARRGGDGAEVVIKTILPEGLVAPDLAERFLREIEMLRRLQHPNIVRFLDAGEAEDRLYLAMEYFSGTNLYQRFKGRPAPLKAVRRIGRRVASALTAAHAEQIIHRDIKPENVLADREVAVKVLDFGIAKICQDDAYASLTMSHKAVGTPAYMAPEQIQAPKTLDHRADIYALGATLFFCLTGKIPFQGQNLVGILMAMRSKRPKPSDLRPEVPEALDGIVAKAMAVKREDRFQDAAELEAALQALSL